MTIYNKLLLTSGINIDMSPNENVYSNKMIDISFFQTTLR